MTKIRFFIKTFYVIIFSVFCILCASKETTNDDVLKEGFAPEGQVIQKDKLSKFNCLMPMDSFAIEEYLVAFQTFLNKQDTTSVMSLISFPIKIDGDSVNQNVFILSYYSTIATYLLRSTISSTELEFLKRYEGFVKIDNEKNCYQYGISNSFPELEFNVNFIIEKKNGSIKLTSLQVSG